MAWSIEGDQGRVGGHKAKTSVKSTNGCVLGTVEATSELYGVRLSS